MRLSSVFLFVPRFVPALFCTLALASAAGAQDSDGQLLAASGVTEPIALPSTINAVGSAVDVFDFRLLDGGSGDGLTLNVTQVVLNTSGTASNTIFAQVTWRLNGPSASNVTGVYNGGGNSITFSGLSISVPDGSLETYTVNAYYNDNTGLTESQTFILSIDGDVDLTLGGGGSLMSGANVARNNGSGSTVDIAATKLAFTTQPTGSVSGSALTMQPVVTAQDAAGNTDADFTETVTLSESSSGSLASSTATASSGVASFSGLAYTATADGESFTLTANDQDGVGTDLPTVNAGAVSSDVVATQLVFTTQPAPLSLTSGQPLDFSTDPVVEAQDGNGVLDTGFTDTVTLTETGAGTATYGSNGVAAVAGIATFTGLTITYTASANGETFSLQADDTAGGSEGDISSLPSSSAITAQSIDADATLMVGPLVSEPVALSSTVSSSGAAVDIFDFTLSDGGTADGRAFDVSQIVLHTSGTGPFAQVSFRLNGADVTNSVGSYDSGAATLTFSGLSISVANGSSETYTVNAYYSSNSGLTENQTLVLAIDGDVDLTVSSTGTQVSGTNAAVSNGTGSTVSIKATQLVLSTVPTDTRVVDSSDEVLSGRAFQTQPVVIARDAASNLDSDFSDLVQASLSSGSGQLAGTTSVTASAGTATFSDLRYDASVDGESFVLSFDDQSSGDEGDLGAVATAALSADVVATQWAFSRQPAGAYSGLALTAQPQVEARDANGKVDADWSGSTTLAISPSGVLINSTATVVSGSASFAGLKITGVGTQRSLTVSGGSLTSATSFVFDVAQAQATISFTGLHVVTFDGRSKTLESATSPSGLKVNTTYNGSSQAPTSPGKYQVIATVDDAIYAGSATGGLTIEPPPAPVAGLEVTPSEGAMPLVVVFTNTSEGFGYTFLETFNDDVQTVDDLTTMQVTYNTPGSYEAVLTIKGQGGKSQVRLPIVVHGPPQLDRRFVAGQALAGEVLELDLNGIDVQEGSWSVSLEDEGWVERVEVEGDRVRFTPFSAAGATQVVMVKRTNSWGLSAVLEAQLTWLDESAGDSGGDVVDAGAVGEGEQGDVAESDSNAAGQGEVTEGDSSVVGQEEVASGATVPSDSSIVGQEEVPQDGVTPSADGGSGGVSVGSGTVDGGGVSASSGTDGDDNASTGDLVAGDVPASSGTVDSGSTSPDDLAPIESGSSGGQSSPNNSVGGGSEAETNATNAGGDGILEGAAAGANSSADDSAGDSADGAAGVGMPIGAGAIFQDEEGRVVRGLFNEDMVVDLADFFLFTDRFGQVVGQADFDPRFDLDANGSIDLADFFLFADSFGRTAVSSF